MLQVEAYQRMETFPDGKLVAARERLSETLQHLILRSAPLGYYFEPRRALCTKKRLDIYLIVFLMNNLLCCEGVW